MKFRNFLSETATNIVFILIFAICASQAYAELKINSVYPTLGIKGKDLPVTISGSGFDANTTRVSMYPHITQEKIEGFVDTPGMAWNVIVVENYAYVADGDSGLQVINVNPTTSFLFAI